MNATLTSPDVRIASFAAAVRAELADLPADDVDDLVDGLEADLAEQASESEGFELPDAAAYAAELRSAAGLPERIDGRSPKVPMRRRLPEFGARIANGIRSSKAGAWVLDFFVALRPVWWILRGWAMYAILAPLLGMASGVVGFPWRNAGGWIVLGLLVVLSVQWGRGRWAPVAWLRVIRSIVSVVAVIALPFLATAAVSQTRDALETVYYVNSGAYDSGYQPGLTSDGERIRNIFAYDAQGQLLTGVQLFDQSGRPLTTVGSTQGDGALWDEYFFGGGGPVPVPLTIPGRAAVWNVYPLAELPGDTWQDPEPDPSDATAPIFPFPYVSAVSDQTAPTPSPSPTDAAGIDGSTSGGGGTQP